MKKIVYLFIFLAVTLCSVLSGCSKWTELSPLQVQELNVDHSNPNALDKQYLEKLKSYKQTVHLQAIGVFDAVAWRPDSAHVKHRLYNLPDSLDMVCISGQNIVPTAEQIADMKAVQLSKGTKVLMELDLSRMSIAINKQLLAASTKEAVGLLNHYVDSALMVYNRYPYDGLYIKYEGMDCIDCGKVLNDPTTLSGIIKKVGAIAGPKSGTTKQLILQTQIAELQGIPSDLTNYLNYCALFPSGGINNLSYTTYFAMFAQFNDVMTKAENHETKLVVMGTDYADTAWQNGGVSFASDDGTKMPAAIALSYWCTLITGAKGGVGFLAIQNDCNNNPAYKFTRSAISILNPPIK